MLRTRMRWIGGCVVLAALAGCPRAGAAVYVSGQVQVAGGAATHPPATISLYRPEDADPVRVTQSLPNGAFVLDAPAPGRYRLAARSEGLLSLLQSVVVTGGGISNLRLTLQPPYPLKIHLTDGGGKDAAPQPVQVWVWIAGADARAWYIPQTVTTQTPGNLVVPFPTNIPLPRFETIDRVRVEVRCSEGCGRVDLPGWTEAASAIQLGPDCAISGTVTNKDGTAVNFSTVVAERLLRPGYPLPNQVELSATTDPAGHFSIPALFPETYRLRIQFPDGRRFCRTVNVTGADTNLTVGAQDAAYVTPRYGIEDNQVPASPVMERLDPGRARSMPPITGRVVDADSGQPVANADVWIWPGDRWDNVVDSATTDSDGRFQIASLSTGRHRLGIDAPDHFRLYRPLMVPAAGLTSTVAMHPLPELKLRLESVDGKPVSLQRVEYGLAVSCAGGRFGNENPVDVTGGNQCSLKPPAWMNANGPHDLTAIDLSVRSETDGCAAVHLDRWTTTPVTVKLEPGLTLRGRVLQADGTPARGASFQVYPDDVRFPVCRANVQADTEGRFAIPFLTPGKYDYFVYGYSNLSNVSTVNQKGTITLPMSGDLDISLPKPDPRDPRNEMVTNGALVVR